MIKSNFYVDNLIVMDDNIDRLKYVYKTAIDRLQEGNFSLRSCNSNTKELRKLMMEDST